MLTEDQHLAEMNQQLRQHEFFQDGMAFVPYPVGSAGSSMSGYEVTGPFELMGIYAQVAYWVGQQFVLVV